MSRNRRQLSAAEATELAAQVDQSCPLCGAALFYKKRSRSFKCFDVAHIYPLNPALDEIELLRDEERLHEDVNHPNNLIALCLPCHEKFDKPRTVEEYRSLVAIKREILEAAERRTLQREYRLEEDIRRVVDSLDRVDLSAGISELEFDAKAIEDKFDLTMPQPTRRKIWRNVSDYFVYVRQLFQDLDRESPGAAELISSQVRTYYLAQRRAGWDQQKIFAGVVQWIRVRAQPKTLEAAEIVASFFVQNCEVFE